MNKFGVFLIVAASICSFSSAAGTTCSRDARLLFNDIDFIDMKDSCVTATEEQIKKEVTASMKYLSMAAFFAKDDVNRPGFAKLFFEAASEEREHAGKLIEYLSMRGRYLNSLDNQPRKFDFDISALIRGSDKAEILKVDNIVDLDSAKNADPKTTSGLIALQNALKLEVAVTKSIRELVKTCESKDKFNHFHFVDYLTGEFLEEQYKGQRDLAGKIATLGKMVAGQGAELGEFLFDKQLL